MAYQNGHESDAKKLARAFLWSRIKDYAKPSSTALVLAGCRAGDILTAEGLGFDRLRMVAVDRDLHALQLSRMCAPGVRYTNADLDVFAEHYREKFDIIFLDFCSIMSPALAATFAHCVEKLSKPKSVVGLCFMYGRESPQEMSRIVSVNGTPYEQRFRYAKRLLDQAMHPTRLEFLQVVRYVSTAPNAASTPMVCTLMRRCQPGRKPARTVPVEDLGRGELLQSVVIETASKCGVEQARKLFSLKRSTIAAWLSEAERATPRSYTMSI